MPKKKGFYFQAYFMIPLAVAVIPILFAKEIFAEEDECAQENNLKMAEFYLSDRTLDTSLAESSISGGSSLTSSFDDLSVDETCYDEVSLAQLCHLLGPVQERDGDDTTFTIDEARLPPTLEFSTVIELPVGYYRTRKAFLSNSSSFWKQSILKRALHYEDIETTGWKHHLGDVIGETNLPRNVKDKDFIGAIRETSYRMPAGRLVASSMAYEQCTISEYNDDFFVMKMVTKTPHVPFGSKFIAHTQIVVVREGQNKCRMICSVEAEFPNGPPLGMSGQIKKGMKKGTIEMFEKIGAHIISCATSYGC